MHNKLLLTLLMAAAATVAVDANAKKPAPAKVAAPAKVEAVAVDVAPPSGSWESPQAPANGHIWSSGYYEWKDGHYTWKQGEWILDKPGMDYRQHKWAQRADGKWVLTGGDWVSEKVAGSK
ncbi:hypothetical protein ACFPOE_22320 [Caenimonas terrae]|uniref:BcpO-related WXXGXW repeat protein n=1 Tax=Caenimonas terrae TaxID=696074 RepID=A0ABW0NJ41_9BURK